MEQPKFIHLLYVPTMACNMQCKYCYLEDNTKDEDTKYTPIETLKYAVDKLKKDNIVPFNISLHGGEVTALSKNDFEDLIKFISNYYNTNKTLIESNNFKACSAFPILPQAFILGATPNDIVVEFIFE